MVKALTVGLVETASGCLLINRQKPPYRGVWNGLGGKVEPGETALAGMQRELAEECGLHLPQAAFTAGGLVHWYVDGSLRGELYLYTAKTDRPFAQPLATREGIVAAMARAWLLAPDNLGLVPDLAPLLPALLAGEVHTYRSDFTGDHFDGLQVLAHD